MLAGRVDEVDIITSFFMEENNLYLKSYIYFSFYV